MNADRSEASYTWAIFALILVLLLLILAGVFSYVWLARQTQVNLVRAELARAQEALERAAAAEAAAGAAGQSSQVPSVTIDLDADGQLSIGSEPLPEDRPFAEAARFAGHDVWLRAQAGCPRARIDELRQAILDLGCVSLRLQVLDSQGRVQEDVTYRQGPAAAGEDQDGGPAPAP